MPSHYPNGNGCLEEEELLVINGERKKIILAYAVTSIKFERAFVWNLTLNHWTIK
jgi:hypothetical protein